MSSHKKKIKSFNCFLLMKRTCFRLAKEMPSMPCAHKYTISAGIIDVKIIWNNLHNNFLKYRSRFEYKLLFHYFIIYYTHKHILHFDNIFPFTLCMSHWDHLPNQEPSYFYASFFILSLWHTTFNYGWIHECWSGVFFT